MRPNMDMPYETALASLKRGLLIAREGWNGKGMYLFLAEGTKPLRGARFSVTLTTPEPLPIDAVICMRTAQGTIQPGWLASQPDQLATDWCIVEVPESGAAR